MTPPSLHPTAQTGFAPSTHYDSHRPTYPPQTLQTLLTNLGLSGRCGARIVDLAAGTGKLTEALAARAEGFEIVAVEPHAGMRGVLAAKGLRGVQVLEGWAEEIPLEGEGWDGVVCGQAFHWFANKAALKEIHRILHPHGGLGLCWNIDDYNAPRGHKARTTWEARLHALTWTFEDEDGQPRFRHERWREVFDEQVQSTPMRLLTAGEDPLFSLPLGEEREGFEVRLSREELWERYSTLSHVAVLEGEERRRTYERFMEILSGSDVEVDGDGKVVSHGTTICAWTMKIPAEGREGLTEVETPGL